MLWVGIDFGAKLSGNTSVAWHEKNKIQVAKVAKGEDADSWLEKVIQQLTPKIICIDAPLSLPAGFYKQGDDFFYRQCDRELHAMSPMFLGGLTARAMRLANLWTMNSIKVYEIYPKALIQYVHFSLLYKYKNLNDISSFIHELSVFYPVAFPQNSLSWHDVDAILAWCTGWRIQQKIALKFGNDKEGVITV